MAKPPAATPARERLPVSDAVDKHTRHLINALYDMADAIASGRAIPDQATESAQVDGGLLHHTLSVRVIQK